MVNLRRGERLRSKDSQHRTKGAHIKKPYRTSDRPNGLGLENRFEALPGNSRDRRKLRRALERQEQARNGLEANTAPALKDKAPGRQAGMGTDFTEVLHTAMGHDTKAHEEFHAKRGSGIWRERECG
ncbi:hypothetical protein [Spirillospora sp. NPDC047279]|uniref:hypothetical protein n=1 Tax=Spirillospora sp. NPDC047279 TaxID=3155478 RepID=UPI0033C2D279